MAKTYIMWTEVLRFIDGDTYLGFLSLGFNDYLGSIANPIRIRCAIINAPEINTDAGAGRPPLRPRDRPRR